MADTVQLDFAYPTANEIVSRVTASAVVSAGAWAQQIVKPAAIPPGAAFWVGAVGTSDIGRVGERVTRQFVAAPSVTPQDPTVSLPQAMGSLTARPSWVDDFRSMFGLDFNPATSSGDMPVFTPVRTVTLDLTDVGTFTSVPAFNGAWMNYFGNRVGYAGKWQNGDRLIIPQQFLSAADNLDIPPSVTNVEVVFGTTSSATVIRHYQITESTGLMDRHAIRVLGAQKIRMRAASKDYPAVFETVGAVGRTGLNQQGNCMLLLDPGTADFMGQDLIFRGARAAGFFAYRATRYWLNRCRSEETQADAYHSTNGSTYGLFTDCVSKKSGDDGWAAVRYNGESSVQVSHHLAVLRHRVEQTGHGRGFAIICCSDIYFDQLYVEGAAAGALLIDREASSATPAIGIYNVLGQRVHLKGGNWSEQDHGSAFFNNGVNNEEVHLRVESLLIEDANPTRNVVRGVGGTGPVLDAFLKDVKAIGGPGNANWFGGNNLSGVVFSPDAIRAETAGADTTPPTLVFLAPGPGATVSGTTVAGPSSLGNTGAYRNTMLAFYAGDNRGGVQSVEVKVGDTVVATVPKANLDGAGRIALTGIDWSRFQNGPGIIRLTATDASGNNTSSWVRACVVSNATPGSLSPMPGGSAAADTTPPTAPGNVTATRASGSATDGTVSWAASTDAGSGVLGYNVYWTPDGGATTRLNPSNGSITGTSFTTGGLSSAAGVIAVEAVDASASRNVSTRVGVALAAYTQAIPSPTGGRPSTSSTLLADYDAAGSGAVQTTADTLLDTSGSARHLTQPDSARRPIVVAGPKSGQKALQFAGSFLRNNATGITGQTRSTLSMVMRVDGAVQVARPGVLAGLPASGTSDFDASAGAWNVALPALASDTSVASGTVGGSVVATNDSAFSLSPGVPFGQWFLLEVEVGADGQPARVWVDGTKVAEFTGRTGALQLAQLVVGARNHPTRGVVDFSRISVTRALMHAGARPDSTVAWAQTTYGVAGAPQADTTPPTAPGNLVATRPGSGVLRTAWDASTDNVAVTRYEVWGAIQGQNAVKVSPDLSPSTTSWDWTGLLDSNGYFVFVRAYDAAGNYGETPGINVGAYTPPAGQGNDSQLQQVGVGTGKANAKTATASLPATPVSGRLLVTLLAVDKTLGGTITAPSGWTLGGSWQGTAGVGLAIAYKTAGTSEPVSVTWTWPGSGGGSVLVAEVLVTGASIDGTPVVQGTESAVTSISAQSPAPAQGTPLRLVFAGIDSAGAGISPATWPDAGPAWTNAVGRGVVFNDSTGGNVAGAIATQAVTSSDAVTVSVASSAADQMAIIVAKIKGTAVART